MRDTRVIVAGLAVWLSVLTWAAPPRAARGVEIALEASSIDPGTLLLPLTPEPAQPAAAATTRAYPGAAPCNTTLQACISGSFDGDTITIAANTYLTDTLTISRAVSLVGAGATPAGVKLRPSGGRMITYNGAPLTATLVLSNVTVENGAVPAGTSGGGVRVSGGAAPLFFNLVISNNVGTGGGGIRVIPSIPVTMTNVVIFSNTSNASGGGLSIAGSLALINSRIERNTAQNGGGGVDVGGALTILGGSVTTNTAETTDGGGIRVSGVAVISGTRFVTNTAGTNGGAISAAQPITLTRVTIDRNAAGNGGGVFAAAGMTVTLQGGSSGANAIGLSNNTARTGDGGALHALGAVRLTGSASFSANKAPVGEGGAFYIRSIDDDFPSNVAAVWTSNTSGGNGGAIRSLGPVDMCPIHPTFIGNSAGGGSTADGGAIYASGAIFLCNGNTPSSGNSARIGGAFYSTSTIVLNVHDVGANTAQFGGCAYADVSVTFNSADADGCSATSDGGAALSQLVVLAGNGVSTFRNNRSGGAGGVARASVIIAKDATIISNTASSGGALSAIDTLHVSNASLISNTARTSGGAASASVLTVMTNTVFANNVVTAAGGTGGAISLFGSAFISGTRFERNRAPGSNGAGGAVFSGGQTTIVTGSVFMSNTALNGQGGAFAGGPVTVTASAFESNRARNGGGISTTLGLVLGSIFTANEASVAAGGGLLASQAVVRDSRFISNVYSGFSNADTVGGGGIFATNLIVDRGYFEGNISSEEGAAIYISRTGTISDSAFVRNHESFDAGSAVFVKGQGGGTTTVVRSVFDGNAERASSNGGGAIHSRANSLVVEDSVFQNNRGQNGGAILADWLTLRRSTFSNNVADCCGAGGAIHLYGGGDIQSSVFISNYADCCDGGGAVYAEGQLSVADSKFFSNSVEERMDGGAILARGYLNVDGSQFRANRVIKAASNNTGLGGAIYVELAQSGSARIVNSDFADNRANHGGAIYCRVRCEIEVSRFASNLADQPDGLTFTNVGAGGAVWASGDLTVKRSRFIRNRAGVAGGALYLNRQSPFQAEDLAIQNSLFSANLASNAVLGSRGNAVFVTGTINSGRIVFNTIVSETLAPGSAMAILSGTVSVIDNIIARQGIGLEHEPRGTAFENFNLFSGNTQNLSGTISSGGNSFIAAPVFLAPAADLYYLLPGSPGIDAGFDVLVTVDVDGQARPQGAGFDIGYDEGGPRAISLPLVLR